MEKHEHEKEEIRVVIDDSGKFAGYVSDKHFPYFLLGLTCCTLAVVLGIFAAIKILDATDRIPDILTNKYGVVINTEPDKQVCYFLLNSSQYWAETGINVKEGDLVSVYASGSINSGIHHVVEAADKNEKPDFEWISPKGKDLSNLYADKPADQLSLSYMVQPYENLGALLMMVSKEKEYKKHLEADDCKDFDNSIVTIGEGKSKIRINEDGLLYFCVNEVYLSPQNTIDLRDEYINFIFKDENVKILKDTSEFRRNLDTLRIGKSEKKIVDDVVNDRKKREETVKGLLIDSTELNKVYKEKELEGIMRVYNRIFELEDYYHMGYKTPWFDDNLGSYLVVVEIEKHK